MSFWDHIANPTPRLSTNEWKRREEQRINKLMRLPADVESAAPPPRGVEHFPTRYVKEEIRRVEVQRPLELEDSYIEAFPRMAGALTAAHRMRTPFELLY